MHVMDQSLPDLVKYLNKCYKEYNVSRVDGFLKIGDVCIAKFPDAYSSDRFYIQTPEHKYIVTKDRIYTKQPIKTELYIEETNVWVADSVYDNLTKLYNAIENQYKKNKKSQHTKLGLVGVSVLVIGGGILLWLGSKIDNKTQTQERNQIKKEYLDAMYKNGDINDSVYQVYQKQLGQKTK